MLLVTKSKSGTISVGRRLLIRNCDLPVEANPPPWRSAFGSGAIVAELVGVLIVDDEEAIRELLKEALESGGFSVAVATSGAKATSMIEAKKANYSALVTDINLGRSKVTGWDLAQRARELKPEISVVYMTGGGGQDWPSKGVPNSLLIAKPFAVAQVVTAVSQLLNTPPPAPRNED